MMNSKIMLEINVSRCTNTEVIMETNDIILTWLQKLLEWLCHAFVICRLPHFIEALRMLNSIMALPSDTYLLKLLYYLFLRGGFGSYMKICIPAIPELQRLR